jgi:taurine dioxygenase
MLPLEIAALREDLPLGARIRGVTRENIELQDVRDTINAAFEQRGTIVFEDIEPSSEMHVALSLVFGPLKEHPAKNVTRVDANTMPGVIDMRHNTETGGIVEIGGRQLAMWLPWHFDHCYNNELNRAGVLRAIDIPADGGLTGFVDGIALYQAFPKDLLARIEGKEIAYILDVQYENMKFGRPQDLKVVRRKPSPPGFEEDARAMPRAIHPAGGVSLMRTRLHPTQLAPDAHGLRP